MPYLLWVMIMLLTILDRPGRGLDTYISFSATFPMRIYCIVWVLFYRFKALVEWQTTLPAGSRSYKLKSNDNAVSLFIHKLIV
jgi:hypothetical protein